jgi:hypothetical protein
MEDNARARLRALWQAIRNEFSASGTLRVRLALGGVAALLILLVVSVILALNAPSATTSADSAALPPAPSPTATVHKTATKPETPPPPAPLTEPTDAPTGSIFSQFCSTPTPAPTAPSPTTTPTTPTAPSTTATTHSAQSASSGCLTCPYYAGNNPDQAQIAAALGAAASAYGLPVNLLKAVAWQESRWHEDVYSCNGGIGLMQIQYYTYPWLNAQAVPACGLGVTNYDPTTLQGNADLGAKYLKYLSCFYAYWGDNSGSPSLSHPAPYTIAWYYQQAGLPFPDAYNASGSLNLGSFCATPFNANSYYRDLPSTLHNMWDCPYTATTGDVTLLDTTLSAYNEGADYTDANGIQNWWYVNGVEGWITSFASGALPTAS